MFLPQIFLPYSPLSLRAFVAPVDPPNGSFSLRTGTFVICHLSFVIRHSSFVIPHSPHATNPQSIAYRISSPSVHIPIFSINRTR
jgi:hypothetical protein